MIILRGSRILPISPCTKLTTMDLASAQLTHQRFYVNMKREFSFGTSRTGVYLSGPRNTLTAMRKKGVGYGELG